MSEADTHQLILLPSGRRGRIPAQMTVLDAARLLGIQIESLCSGQGTCHKCLIQVETGIFPKHGIESCDEHLSPITADEAQTLTRLKITGQRLACRARILGDVVVYLPESSRGQKQIIRKSVRVQRRLAIQPAVRLLYVTVGRAAIGEAQGDWDRLRAIAGALTKGEDLSIDLPALRGLQAALNAGDGRITLTLWAEREVIDVQPGYNDELYGLAVDIGTTTVAAHLCDLGSGAILATASAMNPQVVYGEDVMSRISYSAEPDGLARLHDSITATLNTLAQTAAAEAGIDSARIADAVMVGNTTMIHLLLGISPVSLGRAPFTLALRDSLDVKARDLGLRLNPGAYVHVLPAQGGHVGADNVAVFIAETPRRRETCLIVDVGTNAEIVLSARGELYSASSPTGPAFEGAQITHGMRAAPGAVERVRIDPNSGLPRFRVIGDERWSDTWSEGADSPRAAGICGSGIIEIVAEMFMAGILRADGRLDAEHLSGRVQREGGMLAYLLVTGEQSATGRPIFVTQSDVRSVQLAKAALYTGIKLLMQRAGVTGLDRVILAGAFGSHIDPQRAMMLGLFPDCALDHVHSVGNAAGDGAVMALLDRSKRIWAREWVKRVNYVELATDPRFQEAFVAALPLPHSEDAFPHLAEFLPQRPQTAPPERSIYRPRRPPT